MSARFANDSRGNSHYLLHQEMTMSCGPASVAMVESQYKQACMIDPESRARQLSQNYPDRFTQAGGTGLPACDFSHSANRPGSSLASYSLRDFTSGAWSASHFAFAVR